MGCEERYSLGKQKPCSKMRGLLCGRPSSSLLIDAVLIIYIESSHVSVRTTSSTAM